MRFLPCIVDGEPPAARSGHVAGRCGNYVVIHGGTHVDEKTLYQDVVVLDTEASRWFTPPISTPTPGPRCFHSAATIERSLYIFGGRSGSKRKQDVWVLDTVMWSWSQLQVVGNVLPPPRDFACVTALVGGRIILHGGWDGTKWLGDSWVLDTASGSGIWTQIQVSPPLPSPRNGHSLTMVENGKRVLLFGGGTSGGQILGDLWALKGSMGGEETKWTKLQLAGSGPSPRSGHSTGTMGSKIVFFGGHGTGGWLQKHHVYFDDVIVLERDTVKWTRPSVTGTSGPSARAYHTMTAVGSQILIFGGYNGKVTFGDAWWLLPDDADDEDPGSGRGKGKRIDKQQSKQIKASVSPEFADLRRRLGLPIQSPTPESDKAVPHSSDRDGESALLSQCPEAVSIGKQLLTHERALKSGAEVGDEEAEEPTAMEALLVAQRYFCLCTVDDLRLSDVNALLQDYRRLAESKAIPEVSSSKEGELTEPDDPSAEDNKDPSEAEEDGAPADGPSSKEVGKPWPQFKYYHMHASQLRLHEIAALRDEYEKLAEFSATA